MRGVSLPVEPVYSMLQKQFVVGWRNIITEKFVGESHGYTTEQTSVGTTNGAGPHNVHLFVLSPDGVVLHALPGFWHPEDLARELKLALRMHDLWKDGSKSLADKKAAFTAAQKQMIATASKKTLARSAWQGFDAKNEQKRLAKGVDRDTFVRDASGEIVKGKKGAKVKDVYTLTHERIAARPFVPFARFDIHEWCDYGRSYYDNNKKVDGAGATFMTPKKVAKHEARMGKLLDGVLKRAEMNDRRRKVLAERKRKRDMQRKQRNKKTKRGVASDKTFYE